MSPRNDHFRLRLCVIAITLAGALAVRAFAKRGPPNMNNSQRSNRTNRAVQEPAQAAHYQSAAFAAGCFWGVEAAFRQVKGVVATSVGYTGGHFQKPTYEQLCSDTTGHAEAVHIIYDPALVSYDELLDVFWKIHDPTTLNRQGPDLGSQYRSAIFYHSPEQLQAATKSRERLQESAKFDNPIVTEITGASKFYRAERYHQRYLEKKGRTSCTATCSTPQQSKKILKTNKEWKRLLIPHQYRITRRKGTEQAFTGRYWNLKAEGTYTCVCCGSDLFTSRTKFDSGTGWPSFWAPVSLTNIKTATDRGLAMLRTEVLCRRCDAHLGHVFEDGPPPTGLRYCINSAALNFTPQKK